MCTGAQPTGVDVKHATLSYGHCLAPVAVQLTSASFIDHCKMQI